VRRSEPSGWRWRECEQTIGHVRRRPGAGGLLPEDSRALVARVQLLEFASLSPLPVGFVPASAGVRAVRAVIVIVIIHVVHSVEIAALAADRPECRESALLGLQAALGLVLQSCLED
jgi:hypothetical protein